MTKILLIDDDEAFSQTTKELMEDAGYEVIAAFDGMQGANLYRAERPDLVITDIIMPNEDGLGFLLNIGGGCLPLPCKVIAMSGGGRTGVGSTSFLQVAKELGVNDILEKPFGMDDLLNCIERQIG